MKSYRVFNITTFGFLCEINLFFISWQFTKICVLAGLGHWAVAMSQVNDLNGSAEGRNLILLPVSLNVPNESSEASNKVNIVLIMQLKVIPREDEGRVCLFSRLFHFLKAKPRKTTTVKQKKTKSSFL